MSITDRMEAIRKMGPSWRTDVHLSCQCYEDYRRWEVRACGIWRGINSPAFIAATPEKALAELEKYMVAMTSSDEALEDLPWEDDEGNDRGGPSVWNGKPFGYGDIYLDAP